MSLGFSSVLIGIRSLGEGWLRRCICIHAVRYSFEGRWKRKTCLPTIHCISIDYQALIDIHSQSDLPVLTYPEYGHSNRNWMPPNDVHNQCSKHRTCYELQSVVPSTTPFFQAKHKTTMAYNSHLKSTMVHNNCKVNEWIKVKGHNNKLRLLVYPNDELQKLAYSITASHCQLNVFKLFQHLNSCCSLKLRSPAIHPPPPPGKKEVKTDFKNLKIHTKLQSVQSYQV